jgi:flavin-binding protein dodecin
MMAEPFQTSGSQEDGLLGKVFGSRARGVASREIESLLASAGRVTEVSADAIQSAGAAHAVDVKRHLRAPCLALYRRYLEHCFVDRKLSDEEVSDLAHLRRILCLEEPACASLHDEVALALYGAAVDEALADRRLEPQEEEFLSRLESDLRLEEGKANEAMAAATRRARNRLLATAATAGGTLVASQHTSLELEGSSSESIEGAVSNALSQAATLLPRIDEIELAKVTARLDEGRVREWQVVIRGVLPSA